MLNDIVEKGPYRGLRFPKKQVTPKLDEVRLRCGKCGGMDFEAHVKPVGVQGRITALVCLGCLTHRNLDSNGFIEGDGTTEVRPISDDYVKPTLHTKDFKNG